MTEVERRRQPQLGRIHHVHMVGIGGIGMSSIAAVLLDRGYQVTGSDLIKSDVTDRLETLSAQVYQGHAAEQIGQADVVVYSSAVEATQNPETLEAAHRSGLPAASLLTHNGLSGRLRPLVLQRRRAGGDGCLWRARGSFWKSYKLRRRRC